MGKASASTPMSSVRGAALTGLLEGVYVLGEAGLVLAEPLVGEGADRAVRREGLQRGVHVIADIVVLAVADGELLRRKRLEHAVAPDDLAAAREREHQAQRQQQRREPYGLFQSAASSRKTKLRAPERHAQL